MYVDQHNMLNYNDNNFVIPSYFASWVSGFMRLKDILGHILTSVGICKFIKKIDLISDRIFNILSLKPSEIILGGLIKFKLLSLKKTFLIKGNS
jgi:hypothetical protein